MPNRRRSNGGRARRSNGRRRMRGPRSAALMAPTPPYGPGASPINLHRIYIAATNSITAGAPFLAALEFGPNTWPANLRTFLNFFDFYRIRRVKVRLIPAWSVNTSVATGDDAIPSIAWVINRDDITAPSSLDNVLGQAGCRYRRFDREVFSSFAPSPIGPTFGIGGNNTNGILLTGAWLNSQFTSPPVWAGLKYCVTSVPNVPGQGRFDVVVQLTVQFRQPITG